MYNMRLVAALIKLYGQIVKPLRALRKKSLEIYKIKPCYDNKPHNLYGKQKLIFVGH